MTNPFINYKAWVRQYVSPYRRQPNRLAWLGSLVNLQPVFDRFASWRAYYRYKINLNSQRMVLQAHLCRLFGDGIVVKSYEDGYIGIGLNSEPAHWKGFGLNDENYFIPLVLTGETIEGFERFDFIVTIPPDVNIDMLKAEIEKYKLADKSYTIKIMNR